MKRQSRWFFKQPKKRVTPNRKAPIKRIKRVQSQPAQSAKRIKKSPPQRVIEATPRHGRKQSAGDNGRNLLLGILSVGIFVVAIAFVASIFYTVFQLRPQLVQNTGIEIAQVSTQTNLPEAGLNFSEIPLLATPTLVPAEESPTSQVEPVEASAEPILEDLNTEPVMIADVPKLAKPRPIDQNPGRLIIPEIGIEENIGQLPLVNNAWDIQSLGLGIGLLESTGRYPGDDFSMVFAGHVRTRWSFWGPFSQLAELNNGSQIIYQWDGYNFVYEVTGRRRMEPTEGELLFRHEEGTILLLTCIGYDPATGDYAERLLVEAKLVQEPYPDQ